MEILNPPMLPSMFWVPICQKNLPLKFLLYYAFYFDVMNVLEPLQLFVGYEILLDITQGYFCSTLIKQTNQSMA